MDHDIVKVAPELVLGPLHLLEVSVYQVFRVIRFLFLLAVIVRIILLAGLLLLFLLLALHVVRVQMMIGGLLSLHRMLPFELHRLREFRPRSVCFIGGFFRELLALEQLRLCVIVFVIFFLLVLFPVAEAVVVIVISLHSLKVPLLKSVVVRIAGAQARCVLVSFTNIGGVLAGRTKG